MRKPRTVLNKEDTLNTLNDLHRMHGWLTSSAINHSRYPSIDPKQDLARDLEHAKRHLDQMIKQLRK